MKALRSILAVVWLLELLLWSTPANAQTGENILLVTNSLSQSSDAIGEYYARVRTIPNSHILRLALPTAEEIERRDYEAKIERPIGAWLTANSAQDQIHYIVLTKDVPLRIAGRAGQAGTIASVDSELTLLYRKLGGVGVQSAGSLKNPFFLGEALAADAKRFTHKAYDIYLVGRLDGYTVADVKALIDRGHSPARQGIVVLDGKFELSESVGNKWLIAAAAALRKLPGWSDRVVLDTGQTRVTPQSNVIGFYTWGSNAVAATERHFKHEFVPGAVAGEYVSTDARTFKEPPADWIINNTKNPFGGSHQSLIGDLIRDGITGVAGHVAEPFLNGTIRPNILFPAYASGFNLIESFYLAMPFVSWQTVVVGDPLCAPMGPKPALTTDLNPPLDPDTELPAFFNARRLQLLAASGAKPEAAKWVAKGEARLAKGDRPGARKAFEQATTLDDAYPPAQLALAGLYDAAEEWDLAIERYRRVLAKSPSHPIALNNLAFALAIHKGDAAAALPFADRAYRASESDPAIADTLAWVYYLLGKSPLAEPIIVIAARQRPDNTDIRLHAAFILGATGKPSLALQHLDAAVAISPTLDTRDDVRELRARLRPGK
jgi:uncharacterized protein (TIGR03790 family)